MAQGLGLSSLCINSVTSNLAFHRQSIESLSERMTYIKHKAVEHLYNSLVSRILIYKLFDMKILQSHSAVTPMFSRLGYTGEGGCAAS
jgi:hypothetical protein